MGRTFNIIVRGGLLAAILFGIACALPNDAYAETGVALVIANSLYRNFYQLKNPIDDARLVASSLHRVSFADVDIEQNLDRGLLVSEIQEFAAKARHIDVALIYFAGDRMELAEPTGATIHR